MGQDREVAYQLLMLKSCDTVRHLDDNELATALHLARLALPDLI